MSVERGRKRSRGKWEEKIVAKALDGQRYPLPLSECMRCLEAGIWVSRLKAVCYNRAAINSVCYNRPCYFWACYFRGCYSWGAIISGTQWFSALLPVIVAKKCPSVCVSCLLPWTRFSCKGVDLEFWRYFWLWFPVKPVPFFFYRSVNRIRCFAD